MRYPSRHLLGVIIAAALAGGCRESPSAPEGRATPAAPVAASDVGAQPTSPGASAGDAAKAPSVAMPTPPPAAPEPGVAERPPAAEPVPPKEFDGHKLAILHTANMAGELEPCG
ncbi:MAG: hypothetical protein H6744_16375 [Deltaproteobacteria bacterium]|nr:hypothetical protein [Deltaproteobacteria bacterium]MCB9788258.1 hypothetical protein [Deltaproteobacteria bacterium]